MAGLFCTTAMNEIRVRHVAFTGGERLKAKRLLAAAVRGAMAFLSVPADGDDGMRAYQRDGRTRRGPATRGQHPYGECSPVSVVGGASQRTTRGSRAPATPYRARRDSTGLDPCGQECQSVYQFRTDISIAGLTTPRAQVGRGLTSRALYTGPSTIPTTRAPIPRAPRGTSMCAAALPTARARAVQRSGASRSPPT